jgi:DNA polymerase III alpha subunit (gram-positive type)
MPSPNKLRVHKKTRDNKPRKCGGCGQNGHDRRNCPVNPRLAWPQRAQEAVVVRTAFEGGPPNPLFMPTVAQEVSTINWEKVLYVIFDLETTGRSQQLNEIIEIAAQVLDPFGIQIEDADFSQLVRPKKEIPAFITQLITIDNDMVSCAEEFASVGNAFIRFMQQAADKYSSPNDHNRINHVILLVAHNGKVFHIPFFIQQLSVHQMTDTFFADKRFGMAIDTLQVAHHGIRTNPSHGIPSAFNLPTLYQLVSGMTPELSYRALADVKATATIVRLEIFWEVPKECIFFFGDRKVRGLCNQWMLSSNQ